jgi:hypothetical protein
MMSRNNGSVKYNIAVNNKGAIYVTAVAFRAGAEKGA